MRSSMSPVMATSLKVAPAATEAHTLEVYESWPLEATAKAMVPLDLGIEDGNRGGAVVRLVLEVQISATR